MTVSFELQLVVAGINIIVIDLYSAYFGTKYLRWFATETQRRPSDRNEPCKLILGSLVAKAKREHIFGLY